MPPKKNFKLKPKGKAFKCTHPYGGSRNVRRSPRIKKSDDGYLVICLDDTESEIRTRTTENNNNPTEKEETEKQKNIRRNVAWKNRSA